MVKIPGFDEDIDFEKEDLSLRIKIYTEASKFNKLVTVISGIKKNREDVIKYLKKKLACGGTIKDNAIVLQGDHKKKVIELLKELGYKEQQFELL